MKHRRDGPSSSDTVGAILRFYRQRAGLDVDDVARAIKVRRAFLEAIEGDRWGDLPGPAYAVGFVRAYAEHLDLDGDAFVRRLRTECASSLHPAYRPRPRLAIDGGTPKGVVIALGLALTVGAYAGWSFLSSRDDEAVDLVLPVPERLQATAPADAAADDTVVPPAVAPPAAAPSTPVVTAATTGVARPEATGGVAPEAAGQAENPQPATATTAPLPGPPTPIVLRATADCWIEIRDTVHDRLVFARLLRQHELYSVPQRSGLTLLVGNAGGLDVIVDGVALGPLGGAGEVRRGIALDRQPLIASITPPPAASAVEGSAPDGE